MNNHAQTTTVDEIEYLRDQLRQTQQLFQSVLDAIPVRVFWKDADSNFLGCNKLVAQDAGLSSPQEIIGKSDTDLFPDNAELYRADDRQIMETGKSRINYEEPQTTPEGQQIWLRTNKIPLRDADGKIIGVLGTYDDITDRKLAALEQKEQQDFLYQIINLIPDLIFVKDWDGRFTLVNNAVADLYGTTVDDLLGKTDADFNPNAEDVQKFLEQDRKVMSSGKPMPPFEMAFMNPGAGEVRHYYNRKVPITSSSGEARYILGISTDISERKLAEAEREHLQQQVIEAQREALQDLSTPIIPVIDQIIVMPLVGSIDTSRARDITRSLLAGITQYRAKVVIVDITGVPIVDSGVADHLNKTIQAARLKGANTIITGVSDAVAETIVDLGIDWSAIETLSDLQTGLRTALRSVGMEICRS